MFSDDHHIRHCGRFQGVMGEVWLLVAHSHRVRALTSTEKRLNLSQARPFCGQHKGQNYAWVVGSSCPTVGGDQTRITGLSRSLPLLQHGLAHHTAIVLPASSMNIGFWSGREIKVEYRRYMVEVYAPGHTGLWIRGAEEITQCQPDPNLSKGMLKFSL